MKVLVEVYRNTELVELMAFAKSRGMRIDGFPDNPELDFLSSRPKAKSYHEKEKRAKSVAKIRRHIGQLKQPHYYYYSSTSTSEEEESAYERRKSVAKQAQRNVSHRCASSTLTCKTNGNAPEPISTDNNQNVRKNVAACTKCGIVVANKGMPSLISHATTHSNFNRFECGICGFSHKVVHNVRSHIDTEHNGESFIKFRDLMNEVERVVMKQLAHECFPAYINSPYSSQKDTIDTSPSTSNSKCIQLSAVQHTTMDKAKEAVACSRKPDACCHLYKLIKQPASASLCNISQPTTEPSEPRDVDDMKQSATSSSDGCSPIKIDLESDSDCIIID
ncbi:unnamed protein product [Cylicocyclus nassatus]|uniref:C2H2-type domain-containing protein n=1 Tax=Cylicocyclus nassatus TaxID=53992 RepID=A0AA36GT86_CYLNA|nr:unnamed protein product [Cylicocyclus nassatus]